jgi:hypothetical protein
VIKGLISTIKADQFPEIFLKIRKQHAYLIELTGNADRTSVLYDMPESTTVNCAGERTAQTRTAGVEEQRCTVSRPTDEVASSGGVQMQDDGKADVPSGKNCTGPGK